jgi:hypothetical protein
LSGVGQNPEKYSAKWQIHVAAARRQYAGVDATAGLAEDGRGIDGPIGISGAILAEAYRPTQRIDVLNVDF